MRKYVQRENVYVYSTPYDQPDDVTVKCLDIKHVTMSHDPACVVTTGTNWSDIKGSVISNAVAVK